MRLILLMMIFVGLLVGGAPCTTPGAEPSKLPSGLERRSPWNTSRIVGSPEPPPPYRTERIYPKLEIKQPLSFEHEPGTRNFLVIQHLGSWAPPGKILRISGDPDATKSETVLDLKGIAYGLDFHPDYVRNGFLFVGLNDEINGKKKTRVSRFTVDRKAPYRIDPASELVIIEWESDGHNGGDLAFGADGTLFISSGDGTSDSDLNLRGQDLSQLTAKILRIDVDHPDPGKTYSIPKDNPFRDRPEARPETWAYGLRNPWRLSFDHRTGQLWCGNNGQDLYETAYLVRKGDNYGWSRFEGSHPFLLAHEAGPTPHTPPTVEHHHSEARSLTGGLVYHGDVLPALEGSYIYGDFSTGKVWAVKHDGERIVSHDEIADTSHQITGFGLDLSGNLIVIDHSTGFHKLVPNNRQSTLDSPPFPRRLSETGLFASVRDRSLAPGLIPYSVNSPLWSDGATKERAIAVPGVETVGFTRGSQGWNFPNGSVLVKTFLLETESGNRSTRRPIETRLMTRQANEWVGYSYIWNDDETDAVLVGKDGLDREFPIPRANASDGRKVQTWHYPSRAECMVCHSRATNWVLGLSEVQMNRDHDYDGVSANQLRSLERIGFFSEKLPKPPEELSRMVDPADKTIDLETRARSYLAANCANCHIEAGGGNAAVNLAFGTPRDAMRILDVSPSQETFGIKDARIVAPGNPARSTLFHRMNHRGAGQMPPLASTVVDRDGVELVRQWINAQQASSRGSR